MSAPYGVQRCIALNASRGRDPHLPASKLLKVAHLRLRAKHGDGNHQYFDAAGGSMSPSDAAKRLTNGAPVTIRLYVVTREGSDILDPGEYTTHEVVVMPRRSKAAA